MSNTCQHCVFWIRNHDLYDGAPQRRCTRPAQTTGAELLRDELAPCQDAPVVLYSSFWNTTQAMYTVPTYSCSEFKPAGSAELQNEEP